jgi:hypothetical protein
MALDRAAGIVLAAFLCSCRRSPPESSPQPVERPLAADRTPSSDPASPQSLSLPARIDGGAPHRTGIVGMIFHAAHDLNLTAEQSTGLDSVEASLRPSEDDARRALRTLRSDIVAGIRSGTLAAHVTAADHAALDIATKERADKQAVALNELRALLAPAQREDIELAVRARRAAHALRPPGSVEDPASDWTQQRLQQLTDTLGLDEAQRRRVGAMLAKGALPRAVDIQSLKDAETTRADLLLKAFAHDDPFDARKLDVRGNAARSGEVLIEREDAFLAGLVGVLTPAQREMLAASREGEPAPAP